MNAGILDTVRSGLTGSWLTGPIFDKELRVSSRRKRNYALRFVYLLLGTVFLALTWIVMVKEMGRYRSAYSISRMAEAGMIITACIVWFQFFALQLVAVVMLSTAISDEVYHKTLAVLMTTPINSFQIVMGKLFSKLLQLLLLLGLSLPLLAIVRVLGGVPWEFLISSTCITLTAILFAASVSMFFSIHNRRAYVVILKTLFVGGVLYALIPFLLFVTYHKLINRRFEEEFLFTILHANPFGALSVRSAVMMNPPGRLPFFSWSLHCLIMLVGSGVVLGLCVWRVRKVALMQATGAAGQFISRRKARKAAKAAKSGESPTPNEPVTGRIRRVWGSGMLWKELQKPLARKRMKAILWGAAVAVVILITYAAVAVEEDLDDEGVHICYVCAYLGFAALGTMMLSASAITSEKESRCWGILMGSPVGEWEILGAKALGVLRRSLPFWLPLIFHVLIFSLIGFIHPVAILQLGMLSIYLLVFFTGTGLYFSARFKRTTTAVVMSFVLMATLWGVLPALGGFLDEGLRIRPFGSRYMTAAVFYSPNPVVQGATITDATADDRRKRKGLRYYWPDRSYKSRFNAHETNMRMLSYTGFYCLVGLLFAARAKTHFRRRIF